MLWLEVRILQLGTHSYTALSRDLIKYGNASEIFLMLSRGVPVLLIVSLRHHELEQGHHVSVLDLAPFSSVHA